MSQYKTLQQGSRGQEVTDLQNQLISHHFLEEGQADGIYGPKTAAAVKAYQQANGLQADGIAGNETLSYMYGAQPEQTPEAGTEGSGATDRPDPRYYYDSSANEAYLQANAMLQEQLGKMPQIQGSYDQQIADIVASITGREDFSYNADEDALYQQYKDQYTRQGQLAMMDAMGQAAALGGGYGSSYGQSLGQQQYQAYLQQLNSVVPELYATARDQYDREGDELLQQYSLYRDLADSEYAQQQNALNNWWQNVGFLQGQANDAYSQGYNEWYNAQQLQTQADQIAYERQQAAYANLVSLITSTGYNATEEELTAAGMTREQANAYLNYYNASRVSYGGSGGSGGSWSNGGYDEEIIKNAQGIIGVEPDGKWGPESAAKAKELGYESLDDVVMENGLSHEADLGGTPLVDDGEGNKDYYINQCRLAMDQLDQEQFFAMLNEMKENGFISAGNYSSLVREYYVRNKIGPHVSLVGNVLGYLAGGH